MMRSALPILLLLRTVGYADAEYRTGLSCGEGRLNGGVQ